MIEPVELGRPYPEDCDVIFNAMQEPVVADWLTSIPQPYSFNDAAKFIAEAGPDEYAIRVGGRFAGMLRVSDSFGIWVAPEFQGRGIARRAAVLGLSRYFGTGATRIGAVYLKGNERSAKLLDRLGFRGLGLVTAWSHAKAQEMPAMAMELDRQSFASRHGFSLTTPRLQINGFAAEDLASLHRIVTMPDIARMLLRFSSDMSIEETGAIFTSESLIPPMRLVIRIGDRVAGAVGMLPGDPASMNYFLDPEFAGQGLGQEAVSVFFDEYILRFAQRELQAEVFLDNPASAQILRNLGFQQVDQVDLPSRGRNAPAPAAIYWWRRKG